MSGVSNIRTFDLSRCSWELATSREGGFVCSTDVDGEDRRLSHDRFYSCPLTR